MLRSSTLALMVLVLLAVLPGNAAAAICTGADTPLAGATRDQAAAAVVCLVNSDRATVGLFALEADVRLAAAARRHSDDMAANDHFSHTGTDGSSAADRASAAGYPWEAVGENVAAGQETPRQVTDAWFRSEGHCRNILNPTFVDIGVDGRESPGSSLRRWWTMVLGRESGTPPPNASGLPSTACPRGLDSDGDDIPDLDENSRERFDNCPDVANRDQADADRDGAGDACEPRLLLPSRLVRADRFVQPRVYALPGRAVVLSVRRRGAANETLALSEAAGASADASGRVPYEVPRLEVDRTLALRVSDGVSATDGEVAAHALVSVAARRAGRRLRVRGRVRPGVRRDRVRIVVRAGGRRIGARKTRTKRGGRFAARVPARGGRLKVVATVLPRRGVHAGGRDVTERI